MDIGRGEARRPPPATKTLVVPILNWSFGAEEQTMNTSQTLTSRTACALVVAMLAFGAAPTLAAVKSEAARTPASAKPARAGCPYGIATDGSVNCMTKADFEVARSRQAALDADPAQYLRNALVRCESLKGDDRQDCVSRIQGQGTTTGSVEAGGIYRELVTREVGVPAAVSPEPTK
jgi:hypothetical protein